jgi:predicted amidohydrolase YtcJ
MVYHPSKNESAGHDAVNLKEVNPMQADLILKNAAIRTMDGARPSAEAIAFFRGRILAVGQNHEVTALAGALTNCLDISGKTVLPGFIDAHQHLSWFAENYLNLDCSAQRADTIDKLVALVRQRALETAPGEWIRGVLYDDTKIKDGRVLHRDDLDRASAEAPVIVVHISGHWGVVNSKALECGGLNRNSSDPAGGQLGRDPATGRLDGRLFEMALFNFAFESLAAQPTVVPPYPRDVRKDAVRKAAAFLNSAGICGVGDALCAPSYITTYHDLLHADMLSLRINMIVPYRFLDNFENLGLTGRWGNSWLRCSGIKIIVDGAIAGRTAAMSQGYENDPDDHGLLLIETQEELDRLIRRIHDLGYQACVHANGDIAIKRVLDAIERARQENSAADPRHRIEHCTMIDDDILKRMARLRVMALPFVSYLWQHGEKLRPFYGTRADRMFAHKSFLAAGVKIASGSDHPVGLHSPLLGIQCMVTRKTAAGETIGTNERISLEEAVRVYTAGAAYATCEENLKGRLKPGMLADAVVLEQDPWKVDPDEIGSIDVAMTIAGGQIVFQKN